MTRSMTLSNNRAPTALDRSMVEMGLERLEQQQSAAENPHQYLRAIVQETRQGIDWIEQLIRTMPGGKWLLDEISDAHISDLRVPLAARAELDRLQRETTDRQLSLHLEMVRIGLSLHDCRWTLKSIAFVLAREGLADGDVMGDSLSVARNHYYEVAEQNGYSVDMDRSIEEFLDCFEVDFVQWLVELRLYHALERKRGSAWLIARNLSYWMSLQKGAEASASESCESLGSPEGLSLDEKFLAVSTLDTRRRTAALFGAVASIRRVEASEVVKVLVEMRSSPLFTDAARERYIEGLTLVMSVADPPKLAPISALLSQEASFSEDL